MWYPDGSPGAGFLKSSSSPTGKTKAEAMGVGAAGGPATSPAKAGGAARTRKASAYEARPGKLYSFPDAALARGSPKRKVQSSSLLASANRSGLLGAPRRTAVTSVPDGVSTIVAKQ